MLDSLVYQATAGSPPPTRERGPRGQRLRGEKQRRRRGLKGTAPPDRASPSGSGHVAGSSEPRASRRQSQPHSPRGPAARLGGGEPRALSGVSAAVIALAPSARLSNLPRVVARRLSQAPPASPADRGPRRSAETAASPRKPGRTRHPSPRHARTR